MITHSLFGNGRSSHLLVCGMAAEPRSGVLGVPLRGMSASMQSRVRSDTGAMGFDVHCVSSRGCIGSCPVRQSEQCNPTTEKVPCLQHCQQLISIYPCQPHYDCHQGHVRRLRPPLHPGDDCRRRQLLLCGDTPPPPPPPPAEVLMTMTCWTPVTRCHQPLTSEAVMQVLVSDGRQFVGTTPTSPFAQLGLAQRTVDVLNGMQARYAVPNLPDF